MSIDWVQFLAALLVLFYPLDSRLGLRARLHNYESLLAAGFATEGGWKRQSWLWADPLRAFAGAWLLRNAWAVEPPLPWIWLQGPLIGTVLVLAVAVGVQTHTRRVDGVLLAPVGYIAGIVFGLLPPEVAVLVLALGGVCLMAFRRWWVFFLCGAIGAGAFGYLILGVDLWVAAGVVLMIEPVAVSLLLRRELLLPVLRVTHSRTSGGRRVRRIRVPARDLDGTSVVALRGGEPASARANVNASVAVQDCV